MAKQQTSSIAPRIWNGVTILLTGDGYLDATAMCRANGKLWGHYWENKSTQEFLAALSVDMGIPISELVRVRKGGSVILQGTWVHRRVAIHLAYWCNTAFAILVNRWTDELLTTGRASIAPEQSSGPQPLPAWSARIGRCVPRFRACLARTHPDRWAVVTEVGEAVLVVEDVLVMTGFPLAELDLPDGSVGQRWANFRRQYGLSGQRLNDVALATPSPACPVVCPWTYPLAELPVFRQWFHTTYLIDNLPTYLTEKVKRDRSRWLTAGQAVPSLPAVACAADDACFQITGQHATLPGYAVGYREQGELFGPSEN